MLIAGVGRWLLLLLLLLGLEVCAEVVVAEEGEVLGPLAGDDGVGVLVEPEPEPAPVHERGGPAPEAPAAAGSAAPSGLGLGPLEHGAALQGIDARHGCYSPCLVLWMLSDCVVLQIPGGGGLHFIRRVKLKVLPCPLSVS